MCQLGLFLNYESFKRSWQDEIDRSIFPGQHHINLGKQILLLSYHCLHSVPNIILAEPLAAR